MPEIEKYEDVEVKMLHLASWRGEMTEAVTDYGSFKSYDISSYGTNSIYKVLKKERPDVLVMLNIYSLMDKALITFCHKLGIRVVYLAHGRLSSNRDEKFNSIIKVNKKKKTLKEKFNKDNLCTYSNYFRATMMQRRPWRFISSLWKSQTNPIWKSVNTPYTDEMDVDLLMTYFENDKTVLTETRGFPARNIIAVGHPEIDAFASTPDIDRTVFCNQCGLSGRPYVLYLDDGLVKSNLLKSEYWQEQVGELAKIAHDKGYDFVVKLHPRSSIEDNLSFFEANDIKYFQRNVDFKNLIVHSHVVTSNISTTISFALALGMRVVSPRWGKMADFPHDYPDDVIHYSSTPKDYEEWITNNLPTCTSKTYISENIGVSDGHTIPTIVKNILEITN